VKYCKQIGILEPPTLVFSLDDFDKVCNHESGRNRNKLLGVCCREHGIIAVDLASPRAKSRYVLRWNKDGSKWVKNIPWGLRYARYVLVHELAHYRWNSMAEGRRQWLRTREILVGRRFEPEIKAVEPKPSPTIEINPGLGPWIESYLSVYR
jgi:hypothetical protein